MNFLVQHNVGTLNRTLQSSLSVESNAPILARTTEEVELNAPIDVELNAPILARRTLN